MFQTLFLALLALISCTSRSSNSGLKGDSPFEHTNQAGSVFDEKEFFQFTNSEIVVSIETISKYYKAMDESDVFQNVYVPMVEQVKSRMLRENKESEFAKTIDSILTNDSGALTLSRQYDCITYVIAGLYVKNGKWTSPDDCDPFLRQYFTPFPQRFAIPVWTTPDNVVPIRDFNLLTPYPIFLYGVVPQGQVIVGDTGEEEDPEHFLVHDLYHMGHRVNYGFDQEILTAPSAARALLVTSREAQMLSFYRTFATENAKLSQLSREQKLVAADALWFYLSHEIPAIVGEELNTQTKLLNEKPSTKSQMLNVFASLAKTELKKEFRLGSLTELMEEQRELSKLPPPLTHSDLALLSVEVLEAMIGEN